MATESMAQPLPPNVMADESPFSVNEELAQAAKVNEGDGMNDKIELGKTMNHQPDAIHEWFELTYAEYLTIPRSVLQSMPEEWQSRFVALLEELDEAIDWRPNEGRYRVQLRNRSGRIVTDPLRDYQRGRRRIKHKGLQQ